MERMKLLKVASKYFTLLIIFCLLSEKYLCSTSLDDSNFDKFYKIRKLESNDQDYATSSSQNALENKDIILGDLTETFKRRSLHIQDMCAKYKQKIPNGATG